MAKRTCLLCQVQYDYCPYCTKDANKPKWMIMFHNANCQKIFDTLQRNFTHEDSDEVSISKLKSCDLSALNNATESINKQVKEILSKEVKEEEPEKLVPSTKENNTAKKVSRKRIVKEN